MPSSQRRIAVSTGSLFPYSWGPGGLMRSLNIARRSNIHYLQILPFIGLSQDEMEEFSLKYPGTVLSYEGDWRGRSFKKTFGKIFKNRDWPSILSPALFGSSQSVQNKLQMAKRFFPEAYAIDANWLGSLCEVKPLEIDKSNDICLNQQDLVFDTWHIREGDKFDEPVVFFQENLARLKLIHFQTRKKKELLAFIGGEKKNNILRELMIVAFRSDNHVVIELPPQWVFFDQDLLCKTVKALTSLPGY
jgi:hypothetical protein